MANALDALIDRIPDEALRGQIREALKKQNQQKKFGLVFEDHIPESTVLYDVPVKAGSTVALRGGDVSKQMKVLAIDGEVAHCISLPEKEPVDQPLESSVSVAKFGEPIYPYLKQLDTVCNAPGSDLWHTLIEADNYHALQLLEYLYAEKIDCIYIDPPYNNRAKTWKYNNDYVDPSDDYRHSKWLSMIEKRLKIAKRLLNPTNSVLIVTIDEREYIHLGCLLEEMFPSARMQMISSVINPAGAGRQTEFSRTDEYIYILQFGEQTILPESREVENVPIIWDTLRRSSLANARGRHGKGACGPNQFYPIYVDDATGRIREIGEPIMEGVDRFSVPEIPGCSTVFPVRPDGTEMNWGIKPEEARIRLQKGYLRAGKHRQKEVKIRLLMKRKTLIESCKKSLDDYMECINKQVKKLNKNVFSNSIRISIEYRQVKDAVIAQLKTIKGVGDVSLTGFLQYSDFDIFTFADDIRKGKDILIEKYKFTGGIAEKIISHYDELSLLRMEEMQLDDIYHIELFVNGQFKPLERLSKGQQCTAILNILLVENKDPLIVDQPEDNLDNAFIADSLIASIRKNKLLRHYIFATHNANIPVFGDAELIVAMEEQDGKGRIIQGGIGSIDTPSVRDYAVQVLEGGREAFLMREKKYGIGEYNHFMNK